MRRAGMGQVTCEAGESMTVAMRKEVDCCSQTTAGGV